MRQHFQVLSIVARSFLKQVLGKVFRPTQPCPALPMSIADAVIVREWATAILAPTQAEFDTAKAQLLADCEEALVGTEHDSRVIELNDQARNPVFKMPEKGINPN